MIRVILLAALLTGCAATPRDRALIECQRKAPPWLQGDCVAVSKSGRGVA